MLLKATRLSDVSSSCARMGAASDTAIKAATAAAAKVDFLVMVPSSTYEAAGHLVRQLTLPRPT